MRYKDRMLIRLPIVKWAAHRWFRLARGVTLGVRALIVDAEGRVLLVRHGYAPGWHFPGGGVERAESIHVALRREIREETGLAVTAAPQFRGLYTNFNVFPGDHIALFVVRDFVREATPVPTYEIREQRFFARDALPEGTTGGTRRRLAEVFDGAAPSNDW